MQLSIPTRENLCFQQWCVEKSEPARPVEQNYLLWGGFFFKYSSIVNACGNGGKPLPSLQ